MSVAVSAAVCDDRLDRVVAALVEVLLVRLPLHRALVLDLAGVLEHSWGGWRGRFEISEAGGGISFAYLEVEF